MSSRGLDQYALAAAFSRQASNLKHAIELRSERREPSGEMSFSQQRMLMASFVMDSHDLLLSRQALNCYHRLTPLERSLLWRTLEGEDRGTDLARTVADRQSPLLCKSSGPGGTQMDPPIEHPFLCRTWLGPSYLPVRPERDGESIVADSKGRGNGLLGSKDASLRRRHDIR